MEEKIFSMNGRIKRSTYLLRWACIKIPYWFILIVLFIGVPAALVLSGDVETMGDLEDIETDDISAMGGILILFIMLLMLLAKIIHLALLFPQIVKRLQDMNQSRGWALLALMVWIVGVILIWIPIIGYLIYFLIIPVFNIIFFLVLVAFNGTVGENKYGEDPEQRNPYTKFETN